jgi:ABC-type antimicrobial peptide transport system permease subunit
MSEKSSAASGGIGFGGLLTILFIGLKLTGHIDWSWWWVLAPTWIPLGLVLAFVVLALAMAGIAYLLDRRDRKRAARLRVQIRRVK